MDGDVRPPQVSVWGPPRNEGCGIPTRVGDPMDGCLGIQMGGGCETPQEEVWGPPWAGDGGSLRVVEDGGPSQVGIWGPPRAEDGDEGAATSTSAGKGPRAVLGHCHRGGSLTLCLPWAFPTAQPAPPV